MCPVNPVPNVLEREVIPAPAPLPVTATTKRRTQCSPYGPKLHVLSLLCAVLQQTQRCLIQQRKKLCCSAWSFLGTVEGPALPTGSPPAPRCLRIALSRRAQHLLKLPALCLRSCPAAGPESVSSVFGPRAGFMYVLWSPAARWVARLVVLQTMQSPGSMHPVSRGGLGGGNWLTASPFCHLHSMICLLLARSLYAGAPRDLICWQLDALDMQSTLPYASPALLLGKI